jgi:N-hydroxyarylamine O-acetyltransferase
MLNVPAYFARIAYSGSTDPSPETLRALHRAHMLAVPFENLDIHIGRPILCDEDRFLHKIVSERRGGFCYELNGAFAALLRALGFRVTLLSARVARADGSTNGPEFDHLTLRVDLEEPYLADVGFGDSFIEPLRLDPNLEQSQIGRIYRLTEVEGVLSMEVKAGNAVAGNKTDGLWKKQYSFTQQARQLSDFAGMCHYHQTSPESHFTRQRICSLATAQGRVTLSDWKLIETRDGRREERELAGEEQWRATLRDLFRVELPG